ncbi:hypothetical protein SUGI_1150500 [Cryptomeria japonica]|uniref:serine/threonine-protein kinase D6PK n=1 Tax=Cryptomeria japonica TaxID=3369 RepID=UPI00241498F5|nr:serine/threonine-protein kinase D6PK [Cryptomeria japonica]GLJ53871.1 hypothetical protein SUGI_1150500 [Cryptomeria japonica]
MVSFLCRSVDCDLTMNMDSCCSSTSMSAESSGSSSTGIYDNGGHGGGRGRGTSASTRIGTGTTLVPVKPPHKANDAAWEAIESVRRRDGGVGLKHFKLVRRLGSGDIGNVFLCQLRGGGNCFYAMKVVNREALALRNKLHRAQMETDILSMLDHPFLPTLYAHFDSFHYSCTLMDYCPGGDLHCLRHRRPGKRFSFRSTRFYAAEVLLALEYLHMMGVIYRDLKPENVLIRADGHIMLSDFDLSLRCDVIPTLETASETKNTHHMSRVHTCPSAPSYCNNTTTTTTGSSATTIAIKPSASSCMPLVQLRSWLLSNKKVKKKKNTKNGNKNKILVLACKVQAELVAEPSEVRSRSFVGTHEYLAPEVTSGEGHGSAVDWWTFGVFLFELLYGRTPFKGANNRTTILNIISQPLKFPCNPTKETPAWDAAKDLISRLLAKDPSSRLGSNRGSADIKTHPFFKGINWALIRSTAPPEIPGLTRTRTCYQKKKPSETLPSYFDYF